MNTRIRPRTNLKLSLQSHALLSTSAKTFSQQSPDFCSTGAISSCLTQSAWRTENDRPIIDINYVPKQNRWASLHQQGGGIRCCEMLLDSLQRGPGIFCDIYTHTNTRWGVTCGRILQCLLSVEQKKVLNEKSYISAVPIGPAVGQWDRFDAIAPPPRSRSIHALVIKKKTQCDITQNSRNYFIFKFWDHEKISTNKKREKCYEVWFNYFKFKMVFEWLLDYK